MMFADCTAKTGDRLAARQLNFCQITDFELNSPFFFHIL